MTSYARARRKLMLSLADSFHDQAIATSLPEVAAKWALLMDAALWAADPDGDVEIFDRLSKSEPLP
jgi:hypothetical protein